MSVKCICWQERLCHLVIVLGIEAEVFDPAELLWGVGDEHAAGLGEAAEGVVGGEAFAAQEGCQQ